MMIPSNRILYQRIFIFIGLCCLLSTACLSRSQVSLDGFLDGISNPHHRSKRSFGLVFRVWEGRELSLSVVDLSYREPVLTPLFHGSSFYRYLISPDGKHLAIRQETEVVIVTLPNLIPLATFEAGPAPTDEFMTEEIEDDMHWSPNGAQLAFMVYKEDLRNDITVYDLQKEVLTPITNDLGRKSRLSWSPDGQMLAFAVLPDCGLILTQCDLSHVTWHIAVSDLETPQYRLISDEAVLPKRAWQDSSFCKFSWSPDGHYIAYHSYCPMYILPTMPEIFVSAVDGSQTVQLTWFSHIDYVSHYSIAWSSDSNYLLIGFSNAYLFDLNVHQYGYILLPAGEWNEGETISYPTLYPPSSQWDNQQGYGIGGVSGTSSRFLIKWEGEHLKVLSEELPPLLLDGIWIDGHYLSVLENHIVKLDANTGDLIELGITMDEKMELITTWGGR